VAAPKGALTPQDKLTLAERKADLLTHLAVSPEPWDEAEAHRLMCGLPVRIHAAHGGRHIPMSPEAAGALDTLYRLREKRLDMAAFKQAREHYLTLRLAQAGDPEPTPAPADWDQKSAGELLVSVQVRLKALLGDAPIPDMDLIVSGSYDRLAAAHDARRWADFEQAVIDFDRAWRERICRH